MPGDTREGVIVTAGPERERRRSNGAAQRMVPHHQTRCGFRAGTGAPSRVQPTSLALIDSSFLRRPVDPCTAVRLCHSPLNLRKENEAVARHCMVDRA
jgi:hypothetical protein